MQRDKKDISIIIATKDRKQMLDDCILSLLRNTTNLNFEIVVLDQSTSIMELSIPDERIRKVYCDFQNKSRALNLGVGLSRSDFIAVIDDDCIAGKKWINSMYLNIKREERNNSIVTGRVLAGKIEPGAVRSRLNDELVVKKIFKKNIITPIFKLSGCNFGFTKKKFKKIGDFSEKFGPGSAFKSSDDNEWSYRALNNNFHIVFCPEVIVFHRSWRNAVCDRKLMSDYGYAAGSFFRYILQNSKFDFLFHSFLMIKWLTIETMFSLNLKEIISHQVYFFYFLKGFLDFGKIEKSSLDFLFVLSPGRNIGGAERYIQGVSKEILKNRQHKVLIVISHNKKFFDDCVLEDFPCIYLGDSLVQAAKKLFIVSKKFKIKTIISSGYHSLFLVSIFRLITLANLCCFGRKKFVDIKHGWVKNSNKEKFMTMVDKILSLFLNRIVLVDEVMSKQLWFISSCKKIYIKTGIKIDDNFDIDGKILDLSKPRFLIVGRLAKEKNYLLALSALNLLKKPWSLKVVGEGDQEESLKKYVKYHNMESRVSFCGFTRGVNNFFDDSDILLISSTTEGCPLVALEAISRGLLVISTNVGCMAKLLLNKRGFYINSFNPYDFFEMIESALGTSPVEIKQMIKRAYEFVYFHHNLEKSSRAIMEISN